MKILSNFQGYTDSGIATFTQHILSCMTGNENFPTPVPALADIQAAEDDFNAALAEMGSGGKEITALKNQKRAALEKLLFPLAMYVQINSNDDEATALRPGFDLAKDHATIGPLPKPDGLKATATQVGQLDVSVHSVLHATGYFWKYKAAADTI